VLLPENRAAKPGDWMKSPAFLAGAGHSLAGCLVITASAYLGGRVVAGCAFVLLIILALFKEFVIDLRFETGETMASSLVDFFEYIGGALVGAVLVMLLKPWLVAHGIGLD
jgi:hypothetical protein